MTDEELLAGLKKADNLFAQYKDAVQPYADELARRKSLAVFGKEDCYDGRLGCVDTGSESLCLHRKKLGQTWEEDRPFEEKAIDFDIEWAQRAVKAGINHISISGFH